MDDGFTFMDTEAGRKMKEAMEIAKLKQRKLETLQRKVHRGSRICDLFLCARPAGGARSFYEFKISFLQNL